MIVSVFSCRILQICCAEWNRGISLEQFTVLITPYWALYKDAPNELLHQSLCYLSGDLEHSTSCVFKLQRDLMNYNKLNHPTIKQIKYFLDGCASQYKNYKSVLNLCQHKTDFDFNANWSSSTSYKSQEIHVWNWQDS